MRWGSRSEGSAQSRGMDHREDRGDAEEGDPLLLGKVAKQMFVLPNA